mmetsp:Transcript_77749/g.240896  ORF Transcript_77749/g.240896 Transcript_77749/m.240896 type:complete len:313 (-) Transcript_77749:926-1864(-)
MERICLAAVKYLFSVTTALMSSFKASAVKSCRSLLDTSIMGSSCLDVPSMSIKSSLKGGKVMVFPMPRMFMSRAFAFWSANMGKHTTGVPEMMASHVAPQPQWLMKATTFLCMRSSACGSQAETRKSSPSAFTPPAGRRSCWFCLRDQITRHSPGAFRPSQTLASCSSLKAATEPMETYTTGPGFSRKSTKCWGSLSALASSAMMPTARTRGGSATSVAVWAAFIDADSISADCFALWMKSPFASPIASLCDSMILSSGASWGAMKQWIRVGPKFLNMKAPRMVAGADVMTGIAWNLSPSFLCSAAAASAGR